MVCSRIVLTALLAMIPCAAQWTKEQQEWALGTSALLTQMADQRHEFLAGAKNPSDLRDSDREALFRTWGIDSREGLLDIVRSLIAEDADSTQVGWNYPRAVNLARWGYASGYLQEEDAWAIIMPAAQKLQQTFSSWQELGEVYLNARRSRYSDRIEDRRQVEYAYRMLELDPDSPWRRYAWNLDIGGGKPIPPSVEKSAFMTIAVHQNGLLCVRLNVPNHTDVADHADRLYLAAIEKAVGCRPRVTGNRRDRQDWILDTECQGVDVLDGTRVRAQLRIEAIAAPMRNEGFTQAFVFLQHEPYGSSQLSPPASDGYVQDGLQWYLDMFSLGVPLPERTLTYGAPEVETCTVTTATEAGASMDAGKKVAIESIALAFTKSILSADSGAAFAALTKEGQQKITWEQSSLPLRVNRSRRSMRRTYGFRIPISFETPDRRDAFIVTAAPRDLATLCRSPLLISPSRLTSCCRPTHETTAWPSHYF